jgi:S1-C subfamily serine protease
MMIIHDFKLTHPLILIALRFLLVAVLFVSCNTFGHIEANTFQKKEPCTEPIPTLFDRVSPAVVFIIAKSINPYLVSDRVESTLGTGFIVDQMGII